MALRNCPHSFTALESFFSSLVPLQPPRSHCCSLNHLCAGCSFSLVPPTPPHAHLSNLTGFHLLFPSSAQTYFLWKAFPDCGHLIHLPRAPCTSQFVPRHSAGTLPSESPGTTHLWPWAGWPPHMLSEAVNSEGTLLPCPCPPCFFSGPLLLPPIFLVSTQVPPPSEGLLSPPDQARQLLVACTQPSLCGRLGQAPEPLCTSFPTG